MTRTENDIRLEITDLGYGYGKQAVLSGISFSVAAGEIVCLLGASGSGKTTLLRLISGLEAPTAGRIVLDGRVLSEAGHVVAPERRGVGLMFQDYALFPHLTVVANIMFGLSGLPREEAQSVALELLERIGLARRAQSLPHQLSGGEQQRVALARALAPRPRILLMDEPFSNLDQRLRQSMREASLRLLRERGISALVVTHDPVETMEIADRIVLLQGGRIAQVGTPIEIYRTPRTLAVARFFSGLTELAGQCRDGVAETALGRFMAPGVAEGPVVVAFRPRNINLCPPGLGVEGCVTACRYLGDAYRAQISLGAHGPFLDLDIDVALGPLAPGQTVRLAADPERALVYPVDDAPSSGEDRVNTGLFPPSKEKSL